MTGKRGKLGVDALIPGADLDRWVAGEAQLIDGAKRIESAGERSRLAARYVEFMSLNTAPDALAILNAYVQTAIPSPRTTERDWWALSCLPATARAKGQRRLATLSVYLMETLFLYHVDDAGRPHIDGRLNVSRTALERSVGPISELRSASDLWWFDRAPYASAEGDAVALRFEGAAGFGKLTEELPGIDEAARRLVIDLMRRGRTNYGRHHCYDLADWTTRELTDEDFDRAFGTSEATGSTADAPT